MDRGQHLGVTFGPERPDVRREPARDERKGEPKPLAPSQSAFQSEEDGQERKNEEAEIAQVERLVRRGFHIAEAEELRDLDGHGRGDRQPHGRGGIARLGRRRCVFPGSRHELLPEPLGIFDGEFPRKGVQIAQALDAHEERFVLVQARGAQRLDPGAQVVFELLDVGGMDGLPSPEVLPPLPDALFQSRLVRHDTTPVQAGQTGCSAGSTAARQTPRIVRSTTCHWRRWRSSCSSPARVSR